jgi:hypothetical protein
MPDLMRVVTAGEEPRVALWSVHRDLRCAPLHYAFTRGVLSCGSSWRLCALVQCALYSLSAPGCPGGRCCLLFLEAAFALVSCGLCAASLFPVSGEMHT